MALIIKNEDGDFVFRAGKHQGKTIQAVAEEAPSYLTWMFDAKATYDLSDEAYRALEEVMKENDIEIP
jgi:hypothetical protein